MSEQVSPFAKSTISVFLAEAHWAPVVTMTLETVEQNKRVHNNEVSPLQSTINRINPEVATIFKNFYIFGLPIYSSNYLLKVNSCKDLKASIT